MGWRKTPRRHSLGHPLPRRCQISTHGWLCPHGGCGAAPQHPPRDSLTACSGWGAQEQAAPPGRGGSGTTKAGAERPGLGVGGGSAKSSLLPDLSAGSPGSGETPRGRSLEERAWHAACSAETPTRRLPSRPPLPRPAPPGWAPCCISPGITSGTPKAPSPSPSPSSPHPGEKGQAGDGNAISPAGAEGSRLLPPDPGAIPAALGRTGQQLDPLPQHLHAGRRGPAPPRAGGGGRRRRGPARAASGAGAGARARGGAGARLGTAPAAGSSPPPRPEGRGRCRERGQRRGAPGGHGPGRGREGVHGGWSPGRAIHGDGPQGAGGGDIHGGWSPGGGGRTRGMEP